jgi:ABC-type nitrate/sulfonate/bicarbonate transport system substrate-binding protein
MPEGFVAGQLDIGYVGPPGRIVMSRGLPVKVVTGIGWEGSCVTGRPEIRWLADLAGKRVAVPVRGTIAHPTARGALIARKSMPKTSRSSQFLGLMEHLWGFIAAAAHKEAAE